MDTKQEWCRKLGMPTSGAKRECLDMLIQFEAEQEQWLSLQISKRLLAEDRWEPLAVKVPKLPTRIEQDLHCRRDHTSGSMGAPQGQQPGPSHQDNRILERPATQVPIPDSCTCRR